MSLNGFDSYDEYFSACCKFLGDNEWIFNYPVTEILVQDIPSLVPDSWIHALSSLSEEEFKTFPVYLVKEDWPASLIAFCQWSKKLKLKPEIFNPSEKLELPEIIKAGVTPKKTHEVDNLVPFIHSLCSDHSINRIVDIGSGLGYLDLFLYVKYGHTILGVESGKKLVETSTSRFQKVKAALPPNHVDHLSTKKTKRRCVTKIPTNDFKAYVTSFLSRYHIFTESGETFHPNSTIIAAILDLWEKFKPKKKVISILLCLQANIQFVAESLIVADRVKYLLERNAKEVRVVRVMDDSVSPRALALCVHK
nr:PREDICTED: methyltransferase-like protein 25 isoform X2 [Bemisia tabaci]